MYFISSFVKISPTSICNKTDGQTRLQLQVRATLLRPAISAGKQNNYNSNDGNVNIPVHNMRVYKAEA